MAFYLRVDANGKSLGVWNIGDKKAYRIGIANPDLSPGASFSASENEHIFDAIRRQADGWFGPDGQNPFHLMTLDPGQYYPRIARPSDQHISDSPGGNPAVSNEQDTIQKSRSQTSLLARQLKDIFQSVHPSQENMGVYGNQIRNLLMLAAMEAEAQWKGILRANGVKAERTTDYIRLLPAMKLNEYRVMLPEFPWLKSVAPFEGWDREISSQSLDWYSAYNATKHDRETAFSAATLGRAISAVCANVVLIAAQFGVPFGLGRTRLTDEFRIITAPQWGPSDVYTFPYGSAHGQGHGPGTYEPVLYPFQWPS